MPADALTRFEPYSASHAITLACCVLAIALSCWMGRRWRDTPRECRLRAAWAWFVIAWQGVAIVWWLLPAQFNVAESFPLHVCDLAALIAGPALLSRRRWPRTILYFWGLGLSTQAFFTPVVVEGLAHPKFWFFWVGHLQIIGSAVYDVVVRGYRPARRDYLLAAGATLAYGSAMLAFNLATGANYAYVGNTTPDAPTLLDHLGPWPLRVVWLALIALGWMAALWLAWPLARRLRAALTGSAPASPPGSSGRSSATSPPTPSTSRSG